MNLKVLITAIVCLLLGLMLGVPLGILGSLGMHERLAEKRQVQVLMPRQAYPAGTVMTDPGTMFTVAEMPRSQVSDDVVRAERLPSLRGRKLVLPLTPGSPIDESDLGSIVVDSEKVAPEPGKRVMAISVVRSRTALSFIVPGSHVDVLHSVMGETEVLVHDVKVLAIDTQENALVPGAAPNADRLSITLEVSIDLALKLAGAMDRGTLTVVLRPASDKAAPPLLPGPPPPVFPPP